MYNSDNQIPAPQKSSNPTPPPLPPNRQLLATIVLALVLGALLLGALLVVWNRSGKITIPNFPILKPNNKQQLQALKNASQLIESVSQKGLVSFLGKNTTAIYGFLQDETGKNTGFIISQITPVMLMDDSKEGTWIFKGAQVIYDTEKNTDLRETFSVANDLNWYEYNTYRNDPQEITIQNYKKGYLKGYFQNPSLKIPFEAKVEEENMILPPLLDFLSSVAAQENYTEGVLFALPKVLPDLKSKRILLQQYLWVKKGGDVPQDIVNTTPNGRSVQVEWLPDLHHQIVFYNAEHQLVWQKDYPQPVTYIIATTRQKLLETYPEAQSLMNQLIRNQSHE